MRRVRVVAAAVVRVRVRRRAGAVVRAAPPPLEVRGVAVAVVLAGAVVLVLPQVLRQLVVRVVHLLDGLAVVAELAQLLHVGVDARRVLVAAAVAVVPRPPVAHAHARQAPDHRVHGRDRADAAGAGGLPCGFSLNCEDLGLQECDFMLGAYGAAPSMLLNAVGTA